ncbi:MAG: hypothetical protein LBO74_13590 [Candidatus Symbiothrix sp.]|jgi:hypothetical protein|nr:hypothetical protein [Candidatus Symbiothrix sp.]
MSTREEQEEKFNWWITCIPDKIISLKKKLPEEVANQLDFSIESLDVLENYLLANYSFESMKADKKMWDECASYLAKTYKKNVSNSKFDIELDDKYNVYYNIPMLRIDNILEFSPYSYVTTLLDRKKGDFLSTLIRKQIDYLSKLSFAKKS